MRDEAMVSATGSQGLAQRLRRTARILLREAATAFERTPLEVLLGACAAVGFSLAMERDKLEPFARSLAAVGIALPLTYAASVLRERGLVPAWLRWGISAAAVAAGAVWGFLLLDPARVADVWRCWLLCGASVAALLCVPLLDRDGGDRRERTHRFVARLAARAAVVVAYAGALWIGLSLALAAVNGLFELHMDGKAYGHLASALFILMPPWAVAAGLPALVAPIEPWREPQLRLFRRIGALLLAPLLLVYLAIVYAYTVRVLATGEVPKNLVSPVVIGAGLLIVATTIALEPTHDDEGAAGLAWLLRMAAPLLLPLVLFAIWAVSTRVDQYGWTEFRYLRLLALALLAAYGAAALYRLLRRRRPPLTAVPAVAAITLLLAAIGPWSAPAVARHSQTGALRQLLAATGRTGAGGAPSAVEPAVFRGITDKAAYLRGHFGWTAVREVVPWIGAQPAERGGPPFYATRIGIVERMAAGMTRVVNARLPVGRGIPGVERGTLFPFESGPAPAPRPLQSGRPAGTAGAAAKAPQPGQLVVRIDSASGRLLVAVPAGDTLVADVTSLVQALIERSSSRTGTLIYEGRPRGNREEQAASGRSFDLELDPGEVVQPLRHADGRPAGQLVLLRLQVESAPAAARPGAAAAPGSGPPALPAPVLRVRSAEGFVILSAPYSSTVIRPTPKTRRSLVSSTTR